MRQILTDKQKSKRNLLVSARRDKRKKQMIKDVAEAFNDVRLHEAGKKELKTARTILETL